jgi:outer membrane biosynthesis protein TonB
MTEKTVIKPDQVVSQKGDMISYINAQNTLVQAKKSTVTVLDDTPAEQPAAESPPAEAPAEDPPEVPPHVVEATENPKPESEPKPKKGKKAKEIDMASSAAAKKAPAKKVPAKAAPAKKTASKAPKEAGVRTIGGKPVDISNYVKSKTAAGGTSLNNGDSVAEMLQGKDLDQCYDIAAKKLKVEAKDLRKQYGHLNLGMQRMNLGNRLRKVLIPKEAK